VAGLDVVPEPSPRLSLSASCLESFERDSQNEIERVWRELDRLPARFPGEQARSEEACKIRDALIKKIWELARQTWPPET
jgi:hypothetical protein